MALHKGPEITHRQGLGEWVSHVVLGVDIDHLQESIVDQILDVVVNDVNVLGLGLQFVVTAPRNGTSTVTLKSGDQNGKTKLTKQILESHDLTGSTRQGLILSLGSAQ